MESSLPFENPQSGFSLLELLLVVAITVIIGIIAVSAPNLGQNARVRTLDGSVSRAISEMGLARSRALQGQDERKWGIHFVNGAEDYYEIFSTPTTYADGGTAIHEVTYLPAVVTFSDPSESSNLDIIFVGISGTTTAETVTMIGAGQTRTISVNTAGLIE